MEMKMEMGLLVRASLTHQFLFLTGRKIGKQISIRGSRTEPGSSSVQLLEEQNERFLEFIKMNDLIEDFDLYFVIGDS